MSLSGAEPLPRFELRAGDRVVLLGSGLIEQERRHGYLETRLSRRVPDGTLVFRNLGWAGDTVRGIARTSGYQNPEGFARLLKEVQDYKPTLLLIGYGMNEAFDGPAGLPGFREDYAKLLAKLAPLKARMVLLSPVYQEDLGRPFPDPVDHNREIDGYRLAIQKLGEENKLTYVDLAQSVMAFQRAEPAKRLTTNGLQMNATGSALVARVMEERLGISRRPWRVKLDANGKLLVSEGTQINRIAATKGSIRFQGMDAMLAVSGEGQVLQVVGLAAGMYALRFDGQQLFARPHTDWEQGVAFADAALAADAEKLRQAIIANNDLFYRRWRPFNDHSRHWGFIGGDGQLYDQQIAAQEKTIADLRRPRAHSYEIVRIGDAK